MRLSPPHLVLALAALLAFPAAAAEPRDPEASKKPAAEAGPAMKIHVDPATGALRPEAAPGTKAALAAAPTDALPPLKVEQVSAKAGGKKVRLDDRFMMEMRVSAATDGKVSHSCDTTASKEGRHDR